MPWVVRALLWILKRWGFEIAASWAIYEGIDLTTTFVDELVERLGKEAADRLVGLIFEQKKNGAAPLPREVLTEVEKLRLRSQAADDLESATGAEVERGWDNPLDETDDLLARECAAWEEFDRCR